MLLTNPNAHIRLPSASALNDPLLPVLAEDQAPVSEKMHKYTGIAIRAFSACDIVVTSYPRGVSSAWGGFERISHLTGPIFRASKRQYRLIAIPLRASLTLLVLETRPQQFLRTALMVVAL